ncbi:MAG: glycosyltransferase [Clostridia bacterium]|nr:glycosyltransferase [Clostridia bacterium]
MYKLSIIIPVYNMSQYLNRCLESLENQTIFGELEVIIVNDGSTDNSLAICENFKKRHNNVKLFTKENGGVCSARNYGLDRATSDFICFLDSDDYVDYKYYEFLFNLMTVEDYDIAIAGLSFDYDGNLKRNRKGISIKLNDNLSILKAFLSGKIISSNMTDKIFKSKIAKNIAFVEGKRVGEDMYYIYNYLKEVTSANIDTNYRGYFYYQNSSSTMHSKKYEAFYDTVDLSKRMVDDYKEGDELYKYAEAHFIHECCKYKEYCFNINNTSQDFTDKMKYVNDKIRKYNLLRACGYLSHRQFIGLFLMKYFPNIYKRIMS